MAVKKTNAAQAGKSLSRSKANDSSGARKKPVRAKSGKAQPSAATKRSAKTAPKKTVSRAASKSRAKQPRPPSEKAPAPGRERETRVVHAAKKVLEDIAANPKVARTKKASKEMAHQLLGRAEHMVKDAASASSEKVGKAGKATRRTAYKFVRSAIKFLESVEEKIEEKPARKKGAAARNSAAKSAAKKKPAKKPVKKKSSMAAPDRAS